LERIQKEANTK